MKNEEMEKKEEVGEGGGSYDKCCRVKTIMNAAL